MTMTTLVYRSHISASAGDVLAWHGNPGVFERLTPPWMDVRILESDGEIAPGDWKRLRIPVGPLGMPWTLVHQAGSNDTGFVDAQQDGPFRSWRHEHLFVADGPDRSILEDRIAYELPFGPAGQVLAGRFAQHRLDDLFHFRHRRTQLDVARHARSGLDHPLRIVVTGASGMIGSQLVPFLRAGGHEVSRLVRHQPRDDDEIFWDPASSQIDDAALEGVDAVIHLAGESIASGRWTASRKNAILNSRVQGTGLLAQTLANLQHPPRVFVSASGIGYYGASPQGTLTESSPVGDGFLADVCRRWEEAAAPAAAAGIRVVHPRFAVVLTGNGGFLDRLARIFRFGLGGPLGNGEQVLSWIALDDLLGVILEAITNNALAGPVNAVAPNTMTNRAFSQTLGRVLGRPAFMRTPATALQLAAGEMAEELLMANQRAQPTRLDEVGFQFAFPALEDTLRHELGRYNGHRGAATLDPGKESGAMPGEDPRVVGIDRGAQAAARTRGDAGTTIPVPVSQGGTSGTGPGSINISTVTLEGDSHALSP